MHASLRLGNDWKRERATLAELLYKELGAVEASASKEIIFIHGTKK